MHNISFKVHKNWDAMYLDQMRKLELQELEEFAQGDFATSLKACDPQARLDVTSCVWYP